ncbi:MAG TPA: PqqD family protein [Steroidobacteraceae bacterium]
MKLGKHVKFREERFGGVLFETRTEKVFTLNPTAAALIGEIGNGCDEPAIVANMRARFSDSSGALEKESLAFLLNLRNHGLLED